MRRFASSRPVMKWRFAGHPTLGTAHVVRDLLGAGDELALEFKAGVVDVSAHDDVWTFTAPHAGMPKTAPCGCRTPGWRPCWGSRKTICSRRRSGSTPAPTSCWSRSGSRRRARAQPDSACLDIWPTSSLGRKTAYVFAFDAERPGTVVSRYFFVKQGSVSEDPGTGSACANLGGWLLAMKRDLPAAFQVEQGDAVGRPCRLRLSVSASGEIGVGGRVIELGRGVVNL